MGSAGYWIPTTYNSTNFKYWSSPTVGEGDSSLKSNQIFPWDWEKVIILRPIGNGGVFYVGYTNYKNQSLYWSDPINVSQSIGMKMGNLNCSFWFASNSGPVNLVDPKHPRYTDVASASKIYLPVY